MRKAKQMMSNSRNKAPTASVDRRLAADCRRVLADAQSILGTLITDEGKAMTVARETADRLAVMPPDARLADRRRLISLFDDLTALTARLIAEKATVEQRLVLGTRHRAAGQAYKAGEAR